MVLDMLRGLVGGLGSFRVCVFWRILGVYQWGVTCGVYGVTKGELEGGLMRYCFCGVYGDKLLRNQLYRDCA